MIAPSRLAAAAPSSAWNRLFQLHVIQEGTASDVVQRVMFDIGQQVMFDTVQQWGGCSEAAAYGAQCTAPKHRVPLSKQAEAAERGATPERVFVL